MFSNVHTFGNLFIFFKLIFIFLLLFFLPLAILTETVLVYVVGGFEMEWKERYWTISTEKSLESFAAKGTKKWGSG